MAKFKAYYDKKRFRFIHKELKKSGLIRYSGGFKIRKTGCFYGDRFNFYIDSSDGVNEDIRIQEYCARILRIVEDCKGKPFIFFKGIYSPVWSKNIINIASENNGRVVPFFEWSFIDDFYRYLRPNRTKLIEQKKQTDKKYDIGFCADLKPYEYPRPDKKNPLVSWADHYLFSIGSGENTGYIEIATRRNLYQILSKSRFSFFHTEKIPYKEFINKSFSWRVCLSVPGIGEYSQRMFDHLFLGQCIVMRKTSYDFGNSWKDYLPEVDFGSSSWEEDLQSIVDHYKEWEKKCAEYFEKCCSEKAIVAFLFRYLEEFEGSL